MFRPSQVIGAMLAALHPHGRCSLHTAARQLSRGCKCAEERGATDCAALRRTSSLGGTNAKELADIPGVTPATPYHSLLGTFFPRFREFIVFKPRYTRPLYLVAYHRGAPSSS